MAARPLRDPRGKFVAGPGVRPVQALTEREMLERIVLLLERIAYQTSVQHTTRDAYMKEVYGSGDSALHG